MLQKGLELTAQQAAKARKQSQQVSGCELRCRRGLSQQGSRLSRLGSKDSKCQDEFYTAGEAGADSTAGCEGYIAKPQSVKMRIVLQEGLELTGQQAAKVLAARRCLLEKLRKVGKERQKLLSALGLQLLQTPPDKWAVSPPVQRLQHSLGQERAAVSAFLFVTVDEVRLAFSDSAVQPVE